MKEKLKLANLNVRGLGERTQLLRENGIYVVVITETKKKLTGTKDEGSFVKES